MNFTAESQLAKDYVLLIKAGRISFEDVPHLFNLRDVVSDVLGN